MTLATKVAAVVDVIVPPCPGVADELERLPIVCVVPLRSSVPPALTCNGWLPYNVLLPPFNKSVPPLIVVMP